MTVRTRNMTGEATFGTWDVLMSNGYALDEEHKIVLLAYALHADQMLAHPSGYDFTSPSTVANLTGMSEQRVREITLRLDRAGFLWRNTNAYVEGGGWRLPESTFGND